MRRILLCGGVGAVMLLAGTRIESQAPVRSDGGGNRAPSLEVFHVRGPVYLIAGAGGNITASVGRDGVLLVDSGSAANADKVLAVLADLQAKLATSGVDALNYGAETRSTLERVRTTPEPPRPIRFILNTSLDPEHTGGNLKIAATGETTTGGNVAQALADSGRGAAIYAHENVLLGMSKPEAKLPYGALPTETYHSEYYKVQPFFNGEGIQMIAAPAAYTNGDSLVWFRTSDVISTGDLYSTTSYPFIDLANGGSIQGTVKALNAVLDLAFPEFRGEGGTMIIPGHGRVSDYSDVAYYRDMVTIIRDRIQDMIRKGSTLEQVKAAKPTADYDPRYATSSWSADKFVEASYRSLMNATGKAN